jgi:hypothetical protein
MTKTSPATHLLRELHVLTTPVVLLVALATANLWGTRIGPSLLFGTFSTLFAVATLTFVLIAILRTRKLPVKVGLWPALVSGFVNATVITSLLLAFRIWYFQWPFNQEPIQPEDYIDDGGAAWLITIGLTFLGSLIWVLGIFAVGSTPTKAKQKAESLS